MEDKRMIIMGTRATEFVQDDDNRPIRDKMNIIEIVRCTDCNELIVLTGATGEQKIRAEKAGMKVIVKCINCVLANENIFELMLKYGHISDEQAAEIRELTGGDLTKEELMEEIRMMSKDKKFIEAVKARHPKKVD